MVKLVCDTMVKAAREINSAQVSALVYVGNRDWTSLSKWEIINVSPTSLKPSLYVMPLPRLPFGPCPKRRPVACAERTSKLDSVCLNGC